MRESKILYTTDKVEYEANERTLRIKKQVSRRRKYQAMIFTLCFFKYLLISIIQGGVTFYSPDFKDQQLYVEFNYFPIHLSFLFGFLILGNSVDNLSNPKILMLICEVALGITWILEGAITQFYNYNFPKHSKPQDERLCMYWLANIASIMSAGIVITLILQVYNWFSLRNLSRVLALLLIGEFIGYFIDTYMEDSVYVTNPFYFYAAGAAFIGASVFDYFYFAFEPANFGIVVD